MSESTSLGSQPCGCGRCGRTFERKCRRQRYAPGCPVQVERARQSRIKSAKAAYARRPVRKCRCGCGRALPPRIQYHPECTEAAEIKLRRNRRSVECGSGRHCGLCWDLPERRDPRAGCVRCGQPYGVERIPPVVSSPGCGIGQLL